MGGGRLLGATLLVASLGATARAEIEVGFARPVDPRSGVPMACLDTVCGGLDEDGALPMVVDAPPGSMVWVGDATAGSTPARRDYVARVNPLSLLRDRGVGDLTRPQPVSVVVRVEGPALVGERKLDLRLGDALLRQVALRLIAGGPFDAAAPYGDAPHPALLVRRWVRRDGRESMLDDLGAVLPWSTFAPDHAHTLGALQLVAVQRTTPVVVGRCPRCAVGDFGWPEVEFKCARLRLDSEVAVYEARTGRAVASRKFKGPDPGPCAANVQHTDVRQRDASVEIAAWLRADVVKMP